MVISDTHAHSPDQLAPPIREVARGAEWLVHCGDFTRPEVLRWFQEMATHFIGVHGNVDPAEVRAVLPARAVFSVEGKKFGVTHPSWGGPPFDIEAEIAGQFQGEGVEAILFGHTHDAVTRRIGNVLLVNPGQAYRAFRWPGSYALLTIEDGKLRAEIKTFEV